MSYFLSDQISFNQVFLHVLMKFSNYNVCEGVLAGHDWLQGRQSQAQVKMGKFILSWLSKDGSIKHTIAPNPSARKNFKKLDEALPVMERMILSNDECVHPVPPSDCNTSNENNSTVWFLSF